MAATIVSFRWLDLLEKEFDKSFVDLDLILGDIEEIDEGEWINQMKTKLRALSSCFAQLAHKAQTIFQTNAKLEAELLNSRHELAAVEASNKILKEENHDMLMQLHASQLKLHRTTSIEASEDEYDTEKIRERLEKELVEERTKRLSMEIPKEELVLLRRENEALKKYILNLQGELSGAKLTSKYLDKELAGRIQQLQLLSRELNGEHHEKLWKQLEAEIHLHRHKTVVRACRSNMISSTPCDSRNGLNGTFLPPKPLVTQKPRTVTIHKPPDVGLGMSITGGREHGVPILISVLHEDMPAGACQQLFVGDAILSVNEQSLQNVSHGEAVQILSAAEGDITLEVVFVSPDEEDESVSIDDPLSFKFRMFDDEVESVTSSLQLLQNGRLSRASIDSIRGSTDNILELPRQLDSTPEVADEVCSLPPSSTHTQDARLSEHNCKCTSKIVLAPDGEETLSEHSCCLDDLSEAEVSFPENLDSHIPQERKESEDNTEILVKETSQLISKDDVETKENSNSSRLLSGTDTEKDETSQDVFNSRY